MSDQPTTQNTNVATDFEQFLVDHGFLTRQAFDRFQKFKHDPETQKEGADPVRQLLAGKFMEEEDLAKARAAFFNLPYADLRGKNIPESLLSMIPVESRNFYRMVPFELAGNTLKVAVADPSNLQVLEALEFLGQKQSLQVQVYLASGGAIAEVIEGTKDIKRVVGAALEDIQIKQDTEREAAGTPADGRPQTLTDAPIIKIVDVILNNAIEAKASDIHIEPSDNDVRVRYRIDGILHTSLRLPKNVFAAVISRIKILANLKIDEQRLPQDGRFHFETGNQSVDLRVSILPLIYGEKIVMRILDKSTSVPTLDQLGIRGRGLQWIKDNIKKSHGIFLITGPTGSGKSTTLYAILSILNTTAVNIVTLEDPVEYFIEGVNQSQINPDIGLTFASGLRSILRQDPNIVMVGEIRDEETAELAVHAALTGHLVFSTLHTNNSVGAMPRLENMGIEPFLLSASVNVAMAQRLVRKICPDCKVEAPLTPVIKAEIEKELKGIPDDYFDGIEKRELKTFAGTGCEKCNRTGYRGRLGIYEVLPLLPEVQELIFSKAPAQKIYEATLKFGMITMKQDGIIKVLRGETSMEEIIRVTTE
jgi:type IV pilus assembly protein PilB